MNGTLRNINAVINLYNSTLNQQFSQLFYCLKFSSVVQKHD